MSHHAVRGTHPLDVLAEGLAEAGAQDLEVHVRVGAAVLEVHDAGQTCDVALMETHTGSCGSDRKCVSVVRT